MLKRRLIVVAACAGLLGPSWACETGDVVHVTLRGTIVRSQTVDNQGLDTRPNHTKFMAISLDTPLKECSDPQDLRRMILLEANPVDKKWLGHHVVITGTLDIEEDTVQSVNVVEIHDAQ